MELRLFSMQTIQHSIRHQKVQVFTKHLFVNSNGTYDLAQDAISIQKEHITSVEAQRVQVDKRFRVIYYSNVRVTDSVAYYKLQHNNDSLFFSHDLIGTVGSGSRHYGRQQ